MSQSSPIQNSKGDTDPQAFPTAHPKSEPLDPLDLVLVEVNDALAARIFDRNGEALEDFEFQQGLHPQDDVHEDQLNDRAQETAEGLLSELEPEKPLDVPNIDVRDKLKRGDRTI